MTKDNDPLMQFYKLGAAINNSRDQDEIRLIRKKLRIDRTLKTINRNYTNNLGVILLDSKSAGFSQLDGRINGKRLYLSFSIEPQKEHRQILVSDNPQLGPFPVHSENVVSLSPAVSFSVQVNGRHSGPGETEDFFQGLSRSYVNLNKVISRDAKNSEFRKTSRELNRAIRRGLKENGFRVTPQARLRQAWRIARNTGVAIGSSYGLATAAYKIAENFVQLPKIPIFP